VCYSLLSLTALRCTVCDVCDVCVCLGKSNGLVGGDNFESFKVINAGLCESTSSFIDQGISPFVASLSHMSEDGLHRLKEERELLRKSANERNKAQADLLNCSQKQEKANLQKMNELQKAVNVANGQFKIQEKKFDSQLKEFRTNESFAVLSNMCTILLCMQNTYRKGNKLLEGTEDYVNSLATLIQLKHEETKMEQEEREAETKRLVALSKLDDGIFRPDFFIQKTRNATPPPAPVRLKGETLILKVERVIHSASTAQQAAGDMHLTNYRLIFLPFVYPQQTSTTPTASSNNTPSSTFLSPSSSSSSSSGERSASATSLYVDHSHEYSFYLPLLSISKMDLIGGDKSLLAIFTKDYRTVVLAFRHSNIDLERLYESLRPFVFAKSESVFAYSYRPSLSDNEQRTPTSPTDKSSASLATPWSVFDPTVEYGRMGLPNSLFRISQANAFHKLCSTYPATVVLPTAFTDDHFVRVAAYRSKRRLPVLTWKLSSSSACLFRSSQPRLGLNRKRSQEDERLLELLGALTSGTLQSAFANEQQSGNPVDVASLAASSHIKSLVIADARPQANAIANVARGGGWEISEFYPFISLKFLDIENIHVVRENLQRLRHLFAYVSQQDDDAELQPAFSMTPPSISPSTSNSALNSLLTSASSSNSTSAASTSSSASASVASVSSASSSFIWALSSNSLPSSGDLVSFLASIANTKRYTRLLEILRKGGVSSGSGNISSSSGSLGSVKCHWFKLLSSIINGANFVADMLCNQDTSVLVHCSDGWDRTPQISALAQLLIDPYYRTLYGFAVLADKEWLAFSHKFAQRYGHDEARQKSDDPQRSPIFLQW
jgi:hypothetical protein